jgi:5'-3' exonuclease
LSAAPGAPARTLLIDGSSLIYRAFFSTPDTVQAPDGTPVNAAHGFLGMLARLVASQQPEELACATDESWRPAWRVELLPSYKAHRLDPGTAQAVAEEALALQMPLLFRLLEAVGVRVVGLAEYEAEDVIGTLAERATGTVAIVSGDRDLFQLVRDPRVWVLYPRKGVTDLVRVDEAHIAERFGIPGRAYGDYAVLRGDASDGLPGVRGIGEKTAAQLLSRFGSLEAIVEAAMTGPGTGPLGKVRQQLDYVERAVQVVTIPRDLPLPPVDLARPRPAAAGDEALRLADRYGLANALGRLVRALGGGAGSEED